MLTKKDIIDTIAWDIGDSSTTTKTKIMLLVNQYYKRIMRKLGDKLLKRDYIITTTAGVSEYVLPYYIKQVLYVASDDSSNPRRIDEYQEKMYEDLIGKNTKRGYPDKYIFREYVGISSQPSSATAIGVVSSDAADTTQQVRIEGIVDGVYDSETLTLNGTTFVSGSKSFSRIDKIIKSAVTNGTVSVKKSDESETYETIPSPLLTPRYTKIQFYPTPGQSENIKLKVQIYPFDLVADNDIPLLPLDYHYILVLFGEMVYWKRENDNRYSVAKLELEEMEQELISEVLNTPTKDEILIYGKKGTE